MLSLEIVRNPSLLQPLGVLNQEIVDDTHRRLQELKIPQVLVDIKRGTIDTENRNGLISDAQLDQNVTSLVGNLQALIGSQFEIIKLRLDANLAIPGTVQRTVARRWHTDTFLSASFSNVLPTEFHVTRTFRKEIWTPEPYQLVGVGTNCKHRSQRNYSPTAVKRFFGRAALFVPS